ncbi:hypothetical protein J1614_011957 [Plenodomus biglobosus]|nr:hypothetical protein J1614_011957 [Plenodomus biglobosus]
MLPPPTDPLVSSKSLKAPGQRTQWVAVVPDDYWGMKDLNASCGKMAVNIPANLAPGDHLLRTETIALHSASGLGGAHSV